LFKRVIDIGYQLMEAKLNHENCQWLSGEIVLEKKALRLGFESLQEGNFEIKKIEIKIKIRV
jgi:hypothetical protein